MTEDGKLYVWGIRDGQMPTLIQPSSFDDLKVIKVALGGDTSKDVLAVITEDNSLWTIGYGASKLLGYKIIRQGWSDVFTRVIFNNKNVKVIDLFSGPGNHMAVIAEIDTV